MDLELAELYNANKLGEDNIDQVVSILESKYYYLNDANEKTFNISKELYKYYSLNLSNSDEAAPSDQFYQKALELLQNLSPDKDLMKQLCKKSEDFLLFGEYFTQKLNTYNYAILMFNRALSSEDFKDSDVNDKYILGKILNFCVKALPVFKNDNGSYNYIKELITKLFKTDESILNKENCDINSLYKHFSPLHLIAKSSASTDDEIVKLLLNKGLDPLKHDESGNDTFITSLMFCNIKYVNIISEYLKNWDYEELELSKEQINNLDLILPELVQNQGYKPEEIKSWLHDIYHWNSEEMEEFLGVTSIWLSKINLIEF